LIGHIFPVFYKFRGGKGVATAVGILFALNFKLALVVICIWIFVFLIWRYSSLAAIFASISAPLIGFFILKDTSLNCVTYIIVTMIILITHQKNIKNLLSGKELKFEKK
jgi:glycerol-3-phosphate acyltransferase PlsY